MSQFSTYLTFNGTCLEAFRFYAQALGGELGEVHTYGNSPMAEQFPDLADKVMHTRLSLHGALIMGADSMPGHEVVPQGFSLSVGYGTEAECQRAFDALTEGGTVTMPLQATFWSPAFGMLKDRFGIAWMVNCDPALA